MLDILEPIIVGVIKNEDNAFNGLKFTDFFSNFNTDLNINLF